MSDVLALLFIIILLGVIPALLIFALVRIVKRARRRQEVLSKGTELRHLIPPRLQELIGISPKEWGNSPAVMLTPDEVNAGPLHIFVAMLDNTLMPSAEERIKKGRAWIKELAEAYRRIGRTDEAKVVIAWGDSKLKEGAVASPSDEDEKTAREWNDHKTLLLEKTLGKEHNMVMHALLPYSLGGTLDLYYFPNGLPGTAIATKELSEFPNQGSSNSIYACYELVMFTRLPLNLEQAQDANSPFGRAHRRINSVLNLIARYSAIKQLNPNETSEIPAEKDWPEACLIFDGYAKHTDDMTKSFGLMVVVEVFRSEMEYARQHGGAALIKKLKEAGSYPYSDLNRQAVV